MRQSSYVAATVLVLSAFSLPVASATVKPNSLCSKAGLTTLRGGKKFTCIKSGKTLKWNKGEIIASVPPLDYSEVNLAWDIKPSDPVLPATLVDPVPTDLQDEGLNSSFVVLATIGGVPTPNIEIDWKSSDPHSQIQQLSRTTDRNGKARIWYVAGVDTDQAITAKVSKSNVSISSAVTLNTTIPRTLGRPVIVTFVPPKGTFDRVDIYAKINSNPTSTYYAFANYSNFYTGLQMFDCPSVKDQYPDICSVDRSIYAGREAHFSVWDWTSPDGKVLQPNVITQPAKTQCKPFNHEGSGRMCLASFDWEVGSETIIRIQKLPGAPENYQRLSVTAVSSAVPEGQLLAVVDAPGGVVLGDQFASFNENWKLDESANCGEVPVRSFTVDGVVLYDGSKEYVPVSAYGYGNLVAQGQTLCANYSFARNGNGIEISSGGLDRWMAIPPAVQASRSASGFAFSDLHQSQVLLQPISLVGFGK